MLFHKLFSCFKIDGAINFLSKQAAWEGYVQKIPIYLIFGILLRFTLTGVKPGLLG